MVNFPTPKQGSRRKTIAPEQNETPVNKIRTRRSVYQSTPVSTISSTPKTPGLSRIDNTISKDDETQEEKAVSPSVATPPPKPYDPVMERINRDLNSPSALAKLRAQRALRSPNFRKATYEIFDVPHEEQDLITEEERQPYKPKTIREIFANCVLYVEVRTGDDNRSAGIKSKLMSDGIKVNDKLYKNTTHVIFKDGLLSTYKNAKKMGIPVTSILWIEACKQQRRLIDAAQYPIYNAERYDNPEIYGRIRRQKSMQPDISKFTFNSKTAEKTAKNSKAKKQNIDDTFANITINESLATNSVTMKGNLAMEITVNDKSETITASSQLQIQTKTPANSRRLTTFTPRAMEQTTCGMSAAWKSVESKRRTVFTSHVEELSYVEENVLNPETPKLNAAKAIFFNSANRIGTTGRRSILDVSLNILDLNCKAINEAKEKEEEEEVKKNVGDDEVVSVSSDSFSLSTAAQYNGTQEPSPPIIRKRRLLDNAMNVSCETPELSLKKQKFSSTATKPDDNTKAKVKNNRRKTIANFKLPTEVETAKENAEEEVDKENIDSVDVTLVPDKETLNTTSFKSIEPTQKPNAAPVRKRKLFNNTLDETCENSDPLENKKADAKPKKTTGKEKCDRRATLSFFQPMKPETETVKPLPSKMSKKYIVLTNMSSEEKQKAQTAILKLGGVVENAVSDKTTHIITPTTDRTMNLLRGIIRACYILKPSWIEESLEIGGFADTIIHQHSICNNEKISERRILGKNFKSFVFYHYGPFFICKDTIENRKKVEYLEEIIQRCNGTLAKNKYDAKIIISDQPIPIYPSVRRPTVVQSNYIFDAAMQGKMLPPAKYAPKTT